MPEQAKQTHIPGHEPKIQPEVHAAIERYVEARDARLELGRKEVRLKGDLIRAMKENNLDFYDVEGHKAELTPGDETLKVQLKEVGQGDAKDG